MTPDERLSRLLRIITLLQAKASRRASDIAAELDVSVRTVYRDLNALAMAGVPVRFEKEDGGYRVAGDFFLPPVQLTLSEALALSVLGSQVASRGQLPFLEDAWRAVTKIRGQLPPTLRDEVAGADGHVRVEVARVSPQDGCGPVFDRIRQSIAERRKVRCRYDGGKGGDDGVPFLFRPYALFFAQRAWYAIGHSERRGAERSLKLNRMADLETTDLPYGIPDGWTLDGSLGHAWRMIRGGRTYAVSIQFDADFGRTVADTLWHPTQTIEWQPDGSCLFRCSVDGLDEIVWWVLGYGPHAEVLAPNELRERMRDSAAAMHRTYSTSKPSDPTGRIEEA
jgi:predicted DNA-binding transcriptional regulator YafY